MSKDDSIRKTVGFGEEEKYLYDFAMAQEDKFATYIKKLIKQDFLKSNNSSETIEDKIEKKVEEFFNKYLESHNLEIKEKATDKEAKVKFDDEDRSALLSFMNK